jgi:RNA polymerase sigma-70 factor (ECF subfamily)
VTDDASLPPNFDALKEVTACQRALFGYIVSLVGSRDLADEILQETNVTLLRKLGEFDGRAKFITWACRVAYFEVLALRKRQSREHLRFCDELILEELHEAATDEAAALDERLPLLRECMDELPARGRNLIEQRYAPEGSVQRIALQTNRSVEGLRVTLARIRKQLLKCIESKRTQPTKT